MAFKIEIVRDDSGKINIQAPTQFPDICMQMLGACLVALGQDQSGRLIVPKQPAKVAEG